MFEQTFKNIDDILHKDAGCTSELDYTEQSSWLLFLKYLDALEADKATEAVLEGRDYPLITSKNLKREGLSFDDVKLISQLDYTKINERSVVHQGDVLLAMIGTIGNPTVVEIEPNFAIKNVALLKVPETQNSYFLQYYLSTPSVIAKMQAEAKGTTQKFVGLGYLRAFPISIPSLAEQQKIVEKLDELRTESERLESIYRQKLNTLDDLKKSLLHQAFSGQL